MYIDIKTKILLNVITISFILLYSLLYSIINIFSKDTTVYDKLIGFIIILCIFYVGTNQSTYLQYTGETILPVNILGTDKTPSNANKEYVLIVGNQIKDGSRVIYWSGDDIIFSNSGLSTVINGKARLNFFCDKKDICEVYYRIQYIETGIIGGIKKITI